MRETSLAQRDRRPRRGIGQALLLAIALQSCSTPPRERNLLDEYRRADFGATDSFPVLDDAYRERIALEFELLSSGRIELLREALGDSNRFVRSFAVAGLGILGDHASADAIANLIEDPGADRMVGGAALQALGWLKAGLAAVRSARATSRTLNQHLANIAERQIQDPIDHAAGVREAYRLGLRKEDVGSAKAGRLAPDFATIDADGRPFRLADVVRKSRAVLLIFVSADW